MLVEFLIVASSILVSLFLLIPTLAKITDVRHKTEQAAQYVAWERTVWFNKEGKNYNGGFSNYKKNERNNKELKNDAIRRVLSDPNTLIDQGGLTDTFNYFVDSKTGSPNYTPIMGKRGSSTTLEINENENKGLPINNGTTETLYKHAFKGTSATVSGTLGLDDTTKSEFIDNRTKGYHQITASMPVKLPSWMNAFTNDSITMKTQKNILVNGWSAGGREHNKDQVNNLQARGANLAKEEFKIYQDYYRILGKFTRELRDLDMDHVDTNEVLDTANQLGTY